MKFTGVQSFSIGMLMSSPTLPNPEFPEWVNTTAQRMIDMNVSIGRIKEVIAEMERDRRKKTRRLLGNTDHIEEVDKVLAKYLNMIPS